MAGRTEKADLVKFEDFVVNGNNAVIAIRDEICKDTMSIRKWKLTIKSLLTKLIDQVEVEALLDSSNDLENTIHETLVRWSAYGPQVATYNNLVEVLGRESVALYFNGNNAVIAIRDEICEDKISIQNWILTTKSLLIKLIDQVEVEKDLLDSTKNLKNTIHETLVRWLAYGPEVATYNNLVEVLGKESTALYVKLNITERERIRKLCLEDQSNSNTKATTDSEKFNHTESESTTGEQLTNKFPKHESVTSLTQPSTSRILTGEPVTSATSAEKPSPANNQATCTNVVTSDESEISLEPEYDSLEDSKSYVVALLDPLSGRIVYSQIPINNDMQVIHSMHARTINASKSSNRKRKVNELPVSTFNFYKITVLVIPVLIVLISIILSFWFTSKSNTNGSNYTEHTAAGTTPTYKENTSTSNESETQFLDTTTQMLNNSEDYPISLTTSEQPTFASIKDEGSSLEELTLILRKPNELLTPCSNPNQPLILLIKSKWSVNWTNGTNGELLPPSSSCKDYNVRSLELTGEMTLDSLYYILTKFENLRRIKFHGFSIYFTNNDKNNYKKIASPYLEKLTIEQEHVQVVQLTFYKMLLELEFPNLQTLIISHTELTSQVVKLVQNLTVKSEQLRHLTLDHIKIGRHILFTDELCAKLLNSPEINIRFPPLPEDPDYNGLSSIMSHPNCEKLNPRLSHALPSSSRT